MKIQKLHHRTGSIMINTLIIVFFLVLSGTAFMMWAVDEAFQAEFDLARTQAYYVAQNGILERALTSMRTRQIETLPAGVEYFPQGNWRGLGGSSIGRFHDVLLKRVDNNVNQDIFNKAYEYDLVGTGTVMLEGYGEPREITRTVTMRTHLRTYASYMYLTAFEQTMFAEIIWFWGPDTLHGRVHSNDWIGIHGGTFYGPVSTSKSRWATGSTPRNAHFAVDPQFNVPDVYFPTTADALRACATIIDNDYGELQSRVAGTPYDPNTVRNVVTIPYGGGVFIEGDIELFGTQVSGNSNLGCSGDMKLIDDIRYADVTPGNIGYWEDRWSDNGSQHMLGLISEQRIVVQDTEANGHGNSQNGSDIIITAAMVALDESFTFQHQNDSWNTYIWCTGEHTGQSDERGAIRLRGSITQVRRGYVHRSNCFGTGYDKDYVYDNRLDSQAPPCFIEAVDEDGNAMFDIVWWQEEIPK